MDRNGSPVKAARRYDSTRRREQARRTRVAVLEAAHRLFLEHGDAATTIAAIARAADVSVDTVYKSFANKPGLVRAIRDHRLAGDAEVPTEQVSDRIRDQEADAAKVVAGWGRFTAEVMPRVAPILLLVGTAASASAEMQALREELDGDRLTRMTHNAAHLADRGALKSGLTLEHARDIMWLYSSPELYERLVLHQGWTVPDYGRFVGDALTAALLSPTALRNDHHT